MRDAKTMSALSWISSGVRRTNFGILPRCRASPDMVLAATKIDAGDTVLDVACAQQGNYTWANNENNFTI